MTKGGEVMPRKAEYKIGEYVTFLPNDEYNITVDGYTARIDKISDAPDDIRVINGFAKYDYFLVQSKYCVPYSPNMITQNFKAFRIKEVEI